MKKVLIFSFFSMKNLYDYSNKHNTPKHGLYGLDSILESKNYINIYPKNINVNGVFGRILNELSLLIAQIKIIFISNRAELIYLPHDIKILPILFLKKVNLINTPIVMISHYTYNSNVYFGFKRMYKNIEKYLLSGGTIKTMVFLSQELYVSSNLSKYKFSTYSSWGADLSFWNNSKPIDYNEGYFLSLGKMNRDYEILKNVFENSNHNLVIAGNNTNIFEDHKISNSNIRVEDVKRGRSGHDEVLKLYQGAIAVIVTLSNPNDQATGASVIVEALSMGKPVIVTFQEANLIDIEKEKVGIFVKRGCKISLSEAINEISKNGNLRLKMSKNALHFTKKKCNYIVFSKEINKYLS